MISHVRGVSIMSPEVSYSSTPCLQDVNIDTSYVLSFNTLKKPNVLKAQYFSVCLLDEKLLPVFTYLLL